jgi:hypothetical protein
MKYIGINKAVQKFNNNKDSVIFYEYVDDIVRCESYEEYTNYCISPEKCLILHNVGKENKKTSIEEVTQLINEKMEYPFE